MLRQIESFLIALQFLTRLPITKKIDYSVDNVGRSLLYYPVVGLLIGMCLWLIALVIATDSNAIKALLVLLFWVFVTGGLHLDGLADSADAWVGGFGNREKTLSIMKDPCAGPVAVVVLVMVILAKYIAIHELMLQSKYELLMLIPLWGRLSILALIMTTPYVRPEGLGEKLTAYGQSRLLKFIFIFFLLMPMISLGYQTIGLLIFLILVFLYLRLMMVRRIGGTTGDAMGAMIEMIEVSGLVYGVI